MADIDEFRLLLAKVRAGDQDAATRFVREYEPFLMRAAKRYFGGDLRHSLDTIDVCQSVMANFLVRISLGEFDLSSSQDAAKLLGTMVKNKIASKRRHAHAERRDASKTQSIDEQFQFVQEGEGPATRLANLELIEVARAKFTDDERRIIDLRRDGLEWDQIAERTGDNAAALRKRFSRAMERVIGELGLANDGAT